MDLRRERNQNLSIDLLCRISQLHFPPFRIERNNHADVLQRFSHSLSLHRVSLLPIFVSELRPPTKTFLLLNDEDLGQETRGERETFELT